MDFKFYYYLYSGNEIKFTLAEGNQKKSPVIDELGHLMKDIKKPNSFLICEKSYFTLDEAARKVFSKYSRSREDTQIYLAHANALADVGAT